MADEQIGPATSSESTETTNSVGTTDTLMSDGGIRWFVDRFSARLFTTMDGKSVGFILVSDVPITVRINDSYEKALRKLLQKVCVACPLLFVPLKDDED